MTFVKSPENRNQTMTYTIDKKTFVVESVFKESGESLSDILLKLMRTDKSEQIDAARYGTTIHM